MKWGSVMLAFLGTLLAVTILCAQATQKLSAVPSESELKDASDLVNDVYKADIAASHTADQKRDLARKYLAGARDEKGAGRYVLLTRARDVAIEAADVSDCRAALDGLEKSFDVDALKLRADAYTRLAGNVHLPDDRMSLADELSATVKAAMGADRFDLANAVSRLEQSNAHAVSDAALNKLATEDLQALHEAETAYNDAKAALAILEKTPADPDANLKAGKYYCFIKADWQKGLPMLARSSDEQLKALAAKPVTTASTADDLVKLGDDWWDVSEKLTPIAKANVQAHAGELYKTALPRLTGLVKLKTEKRIAEAAPPDPNNGWVVLMRSSDPTIWNTDTDKGHNTYAISLKNAPKNIQFLRISLPSGDYVIIPMTFDRLPLGSDRSGRTGPRTKPGTAWNGECGFSYKAYHLGIYGSAPPLLAYPLPKGVIAVGQELSGWGFGNRSWIDDVQGYSWAGKEIPKTVFEIAVKSTPLTDKEKKKLKE